MLCHTLSGEQCTALLIKFLQWRWFFHFNAWEMLASSLEGDRDLGGMASIAQFVFVPGGGGLNSDALASFLISSDLFLSLSHISVVSSMSYLIFYFIGCFCLSISKLFLPLTPCEIRVQDFSTLKLNLTFVLDLSWSYHKIAWKSLTTGESCLCLLSMSFANQESQGLSLKIIH